MARSAGGIGGSGVYGGVGLGTVIQCKSDDTSFYCSFMKMANMIIMAFVVLAVLYFGFQFISNVFFKKRGGGGGGSGGRVR